MTEFRASSTTASSTLSLIGNTPLVSLDRIWPGPGRLVAKAEFLQPGGSVKDRAALAIVEAARKDGRLKPGAPVVEMTSGNMGAGLAVVCAALGHPAVCTMSSGNSKERARMMEGLGAEVILVDQVSGIYGKVTGEDIDKATEVARQIASQRGGFYVDQFNAIEPIKAHEQRTGKELLAQLDEPVAAWVASIGTGATFIGVARALKRANRDTKCFASEPLGCEILAGQKITRKQHIIQGTGYGLRPPHWDDTLVDGYLAVSDVEVHKMKGRLGREEGLYVGLSAAANVLSAVKLLQSGDLHADATIATVLCDTGLKY
ncbi:MAG: cysteine synthase family protein [Henriciella sp.]